MNWVRGAALALKGTINGTETDFDGNFTMKVSERNSILIFMSLGYKTQEININGKKVINVIMKTDLNQLDEVVLTVQARGQKRLFKTR